MVSQRLYCMSFSQGHVDGAKKGDQLLFALRTWGPEFGPQTHFKKLSVVVGAHNLLGTMCACVCIKPEVNLECCSSASGHFIFWGSLSLAQSFWIEGLAGQWGPGLDLPVSASPGDYVNEYQHMEMVTGVCLGGVGIQVWSGVVGIFFGCQPAPK